MPTGKPFKALGTLVIAMFAVWGMVYLLIHLNVLDSTSAEAKVLIFGVPVAFMAYIVPVFLLKNAPKAAKEPEKEDDFEVKNIAEEDPEPQPVDKKD